VEGVIAAMGATYPEIVQNKAYIQLASPTRSGPSPPLSTGVSGGSRRNSNE